MAMRTVAPTEVARWRLDNERGICPELRQVGQPVAPQGAVEVWHCQRQQPVGARRQGGRPWYQRQPRAWFKPVFAALLFVRERWQAFAVIAVVGGVFGLAWWATGLLAA